MSSPLAQNMCFAFQSPPSPSTMRCHLPHNPYFASTDSLCIGTSRSIRCSIVESPVLIIQYLIIGSLHTKIGRASCRERGEIVVARVELRYRTDVNIADL